MKEKPDGDAGEGGQRGSCKGNSNRPCAQSLPVHLRNSMSGVARQSFRGSAMAAGLSLGSSSIKEKHDKPHEFVQVHFNKPTWCKSCGKFIWGVTNKQGYRCSGCGFTAHPKCWKGVTGPCLNVKLDKKVSQEDFANPSKLPVGMQMPSEFMEMTPTLEQATSYIKEFPHHSLSYRDEKGQTLLHAAIKEGRVDIVDYIVENQLPCDLTLEDHDGWTPLHLACKTGNLEIARILLQTAGVFGGDERLDRDHPMHLLIESGLKPDNCQELYETVLQELVKNGADIDARNKHNETPIEMTQLRGLGFVAAVLVKLKADRVENQIQELLLLPNCDPDLKAKVELNMKLGDSLQSTTDRRLMILLAAKTKSKVGFSNMKAASLRNKQRLAASHRTPLNFPPRDVSVTDQGNLKGHLTEHNIEWHSTA